MDSFELKAIITAVDKLTGPLQGMQRQVKGFKKEMASLSKIASTAGFGIAGMFAVPIHEAIEFDEQMSEVRKVVKGMDDQTAFTQMSRDILDLASSIPMSLEGITAIVAAAGQAGVDHSALKQFATDAAHVGVAFSMSAEDAGQAMTAWRAAFKMPQADIERLTDQISYLGRNGKANGAQIASVVTDVSSIAKAAHVSAEDLAALAATTMGVGIQSDVAATGIKNFLKALTSSNSGNAKKVLHAIHLNPSQVANGMVKDARGTMIKVLDGINKLPEAKKAKALTLLFGSESSAAITPLLNNLDTLKGYLKDVSDAQIYAGSTQTEFNKVTSNTKAQLQVLSNNLNIVGVDIGKTFLPAINDAVKDMVPFIKQFDEFIQKNPDVITQVENLSKSLIGTGLALGTVSKASKIVNSLMEASPAKGFMGLLVWGSYEVMQHWDKVGPVVEGALKHFDDGSNKVDQWQSALTNLSDFVENIFAANMVASFTKMFAGLNAIPVPGWLGMIEYGQYLINDRENIADSASSAWDSWMGDIGDIGRGLGIDNNWGLEHSVHGPVPTSPDMQIPGDPAVLPSPGPNSENLYKNTATSQKSATELKITIDDNSAPKLQVVKPGGFGSINHDVGYSPFRKSQ